MELSINSVFLETAQMFLFAIMAITLIVYIIAPAMFFPIMKAEQEIMTRFGIVKPMRMLNPDQTVEPFKYMGIVVSFLALANLLVEIIKVRSIEEGEISEQTDNPFVAVPVTQ